MRKLLTGIFAAAIAVLSLAACSTSISSGPNLTCANKVVKEITTDKSVPGLWNCLTSKFQTTLKTYAATGLVISADDAVFTTGNNAAPPVLSTKFVGQENGVDVYTVVFKGRDGLPTTLTATLWVDSSGKVDNLGIGIPIF
jgi:hypothetical protein